ncbi:MAG TPA: GNAT family N-acetyltransferase [Roseiflexaceae bacterium]|nr:GNAT family N-acetyltransferase [Roseiflexaceae bacterium]HMP38837.1 GNAT family N-acetyltransferase [Roseiflexaceae bacterium]
MTQRVEAPVAMTLRDGRRVLIRALGEHDRPALMEFGGALPKDDWIYLEDDLRNPEIITRLVNAHAAENWRQVVAVADNGCIVGYSAVRRLSGWSSHVGDIQLIIDPAWRRQGLGTVLARAICDAARALGVAKVIVEIMAEQVGGHAIFERLGFSVEGTFASHARDRHGHCHDLHVLAQQIS